MKIYSLNSLKKVVLRSTFLCCSTLWWIYFYRWSCSLLFPLHSFILPSSLLLFCLALSLFFVACLVFSCLICSLFSCQSLYYALVFCPISLLSSQVSPAMSCDGLFSVLLTFACVLLFRCIFSDLFSYVCVLVVCFL